MAETLGAYTLDETCPICGTEIELPEANLLLEQEPTVDAKCPECGQRLRVRRTGWVIYHVIGREVGDIQAQGAGSGAGGA